MRPSAKSWANTTGLKQLIGRYPFGMICPAGGLKRRPPGTELMVFPPRLRLETPR